LAFSDDLPFFEQSDYPNLVTGAYVITSEDDPRYNCIAWAVGDERRWWWPDAAGDHFWPAGVPREPTIEAFIAAYGTFGFKRCADGALESGIEKIAIYALDGAPTHAARQLSTGLWTSKLGVDHDISHEDRSAVNGPIYGASVCFLARPRPR
jgi:hypothetical protein